MQSDAAWPQQVMKCERALVTGGDFITDSGIVGGNFYLGNHRYSGFTYANGSYTIVSVPKSKATYVDCMDEQGNTGGSFNYGSYSNPKYAGFVDIGSKATSYVFPGSANTSVFKVISATENYGVYDINNVISAYHYVNGVYHNFAVPLLSPQITGFNASGSFSGWGQDPKTFATVGFLATCAAGPGQCTD